LTSSYLITGTTSGIGQSLRDLLLSKNIKVLAINRKDTNNLGSESNYYFDITNFEEVFNFLKKLKDNNKIPDVFVLNAGVNFFDNQNIFLIEDFKKCFDINFYGSMNFVSAVEKLSIKNVCFVIMSSTSNIIPNPAALGYFSSKLILSEITKFLSTNNSFKTIILGPVKTQISRSIGEPKGLAKKIYNFLAITPDIAANEIFKFINNGDKNRFFYTKKSYLFYKLIRLVLFLFPNIYKGGKN
jgi:NADP-dependent 3-hydroxy acid dehydrogenase YdfG|tara:strand:+ start:2036 stop:2761 length:726 start_codon:yes stop_codon:yes gene_type:complete